MNTNQVMEWGEKHHFPFLALSNTPNDVVKHGQREWLKLVLTGNQEQLAKLVKRIERWNELERKAEGKIS